MVNLNQLEQVLEYIEKINETLRQDPEETDYIFNKLGDFREAVVKGLKELVWYKYAESRV